MYYMLDENHVPVRLPGDHAAWPKNVDAEEQRRVARTRLNGYTVSTVFLGIDHNHGSSGPPILFETMVFGGNQESEYQVRTSTWADAQAEHGAACERVANWPCGGCFADE
jgi:hypothetical protein